MLIKNPMRHYPTFTAKVYYTNGKMCGQSATAETEMISFPGEEEDILAIVLVARDEGNRPATTKMWAEGLWQAYSEELLDQLRYPKQEEEVEEEVEEEREVEEEVLPVVPILWPQSHECSHTNAIRETAVWNDKIDGMKDTNE